VRITVDVYSALLAMFSAAVAWGWRCAQNVPNNRPESCDAGVCIYAEVPVQSHLVFRHSLEEIAERHPGGSGELDGVPRCAF